MPVLGIDIGGTKIAAGVVNESADVLRSAEFPTRAAQGFETSIAQVYRAVEEVLAPEITAIGICAPGPLNPKTGVVLNPPNLPGWNHIPLAQLIEERFARLCRVENDANAAGLAETLFGAARGYSSVLYMTWSTGIGTGIVLDGRIYHGKNGAAAEGGHVTVDYRGEAPCACGVPGCIEGLASGTAIAARASRLMGRTVTAAEVGRAAQAGDPAAAQVIAEAVDMVAAWLGSMISMLDPDIVVIGGGVAQLGEPLFAKLRAETPRRTINQFAVETPIVPAALCRNAGILGAAAVVV